MLGSRFSILGGDDMKMSTAIALAAGMLALATTQASAQNTAGTTPTASDGKQKAVINTSRSNIKKPGMTTSNTGDGKQKAAISTSRSNIKRPD
jgi:hypothetical protein